MVAAISQIPGILVSSVAMAYSDRKGQQKILTASLLFFATAPFLYLFVTNVYELAAVRFYHGFATGIFTPGVYLETQKSGTCGGTATANDNPVSISNFAFVPNIIPSM